MQQGGEVCTYNIINNDKTRPFRKIPKDMMFVVIDETSELFIITINENSEGEVYKLADDIIFAAYIESELYAKLNRYYICVAKEEKDFCRCNVSPDPKIGRELLQNFATIVESDLERSGLGQ